MNISSLDLALVVFYFVVVVGYGIWRSFRVSDSAEFLVAGRKLGIFTLVATLVMTEFNTATMVGYSSFGYQAGFYSQLMLVATVLGFMCYTFIVAKRWKRINANSLIELFEIRYSKNFRLLATFMTVGLLLFFSPAYLRAVGIIFSSSIGISLTTTVVVISISVLLFSVVGGLTAVVHTNTLSFILTIVALPLFLYFSKVHSMELGGPAEVFPEKYLSLNPEGMWNDPILPFSLIMATWFLKFFVYMQSPWYAQLMTAAKNEKVAYISMGIGSIFIVLLYGISFQIATYARAGFTDLDDPQLSLPMVINNWLPIGVTGIVLACVFSIGQTTIASIWSNIVAITSNDIYKRILYPGASEKKTLNFSRFVTVFVALFTIVISITIVDQVINVLFLGNIIMVSLFFPALGGFLWWKTGERAVWITTIASIVVGFASYLLMKQTGVYSINDWMFTYYVIIYPIILFIGILISLVEKPTDKFMEKRVKFFDIVGQPWFGRKAYLEYKRANTSLTN